MLKLAHPLLSNRELEKRPGFESRLLATTLPRCFPPWKVKPDCDALLDELCRTASRAVKADTLF